MYRYQLEPAGKIRQRICCPGCGNKRTYKRYIDTETGYYLADHVGRCNREVKCGYHYPPALYFTGQPAQPHRNIIRPAMPVAQPPSLLPPDLMVRSFAGYHSNNFVQFLISRLGTALARKLAGRYHLGSSRHWQGATVFWQVDINGKVRTGKIMLYDEASGKRVKTPFNHITWVHTVMQLPGYAFQQCFFGEHLLPNHTRTDTYPIVAIVESEKTAVIASAYYPQYIWLACGSLSNLTAAKCEVLRGMRVMLFPDLNCYHKWCDKAKELKHITDIQVYAGMEQKATVQERLQGLDIADYLLRTPPGNYSIAA